jgi:hypothetical protein
MVSGLFLECAALGILYGAAGACAVAVVIVAWCWLRARTSRKGAAS